MGHQAVHVVSTIQIGTLTAAHQGTLYSLLSRTWNWIIHTGFQWISLLPFLFLTFTSFLKALCIISLYSYSSSAYLSQIEYNPCVFWCPTRPFMIWPLAISLNFFTTASNTNRYISYSSLLTIPRACQVLSDLWSLELLFLSNWMAGSSQGVLWFIPPVHSGFCSNMCLKSLLALPWLQPFLRFNSIVDYIKWWLILWVKLIVLWYAQVFSQTFLGIFGWD